MRVYQGNISNHTLAFYSGDGAKALAVGAGLTLITALVFKKMRSPQVDPKTAAPLSIWTPRIKAGFGVYALSTLALSAYLFQPVVDKKRFTCRLLKEGYALVPMLPENEREDAYGKLIIAEAQIDPLSAASKLEQSGSESLKDQVAGKMVESLLPINLDLACQYLARANTCLPWCYAPLFALLVHDDKPRAIEEAGRQKDDVKPYAYEVLLRRMIRQGNLDQAIQVIKRVEEDSVRGDVIERICPLLPNPRALIDDCLPVYLSNYLKEEVVAKLENPQLIKREIKDKFKQRAYGGYLEKYDDNPTIAQEVIGELFQEGNDWFFQSLIEEMIKVLRLEEVEELFVEYPRAQGVDIRELAQKDFNRAKRIVQGLEDQPTKDACLLDLVILECGVCPEAAQAIAQEIQSVDLKNEALLAVVAAELFLAPRVAKRTVASLDNIEIQQGFKEIQLWIAYVQGRLSVDLVDQAAGLGQNFKDYFYEILAYQAAQTDVEKGREIASRFQNKERCKKMQDPTFSVEDAKDVLSEELQESLNRLLFFGMWRNPKLCDAALQKIERPKDRLKAITSIIQAQGQRSAHR